MLGYEYKWWNVLPPNMKTSCFNVGNSKCDDMNGEHTHHPGTGGEGNSTQGGPEVKTGTKSQAKTDIY